MYESIKRIYIRTRNSLYLTAAVNKGWITQEDCDRIIAEVD